VGELPAAPRASPNPRWRCRSHGHDRATCPRDFPSHRLARSSTCEYTFLDSSHDDPSRLLGVSCVRVGALRCRTSATIFCRNFRKAGAATPGVTLPVLTQVRLLSSLPAGIVSHFGVDPPLYLDRLHRRDHSSIAVVRPFASFVSSQVPPQGGEPAPTRLEPEARRRAASAARDRRQVNKPL